MLLESRQLGMEVLEHHDGGYHLFDVYSTILLLPSLRVA